MGYRVRVLGERDRIVEIFKLQSALLAKNLKIDIELVSGTPQNWSEILLKHTGGADIAVVTRDPVAEGTLGAEEIDEYMESLDGARPVSGAAWLKNYLPTVSVIYAFQILFGAEKGDGWAAIDEIRDLLWRATGGILQADGEGFTNLEGYHILWEFDESAKGTRRMAVCDTLGSWQRFEMNLGKSRHRRAFLEGEVPKGVRML